MTLLQTLKKALPLLNERRIFMSNIYKGTLGLIGNTPLVEAVNIEKT